MNATSLYVSTCRLILQANTEDPSTWQDLYRLVPYLRQSLSCTVCGNLLIEPHTPINTETNCQHHVCRNCRGGRKRLKPTCGWCKDYDRYAENVQLRILLQCYKKLCEYLTSTQVYRCMLANLASSNNGASSLAELIQEGAGFRDSSYKSNAGLSKSAYSILPCVYTSSISTQTQSSNSSIQSDSHRDSAPPPPPAAIKTVSNGSEIYSVMYAGTGNKITIKRKAAVMEETTDKSHFQQQEAVLHQQQQSGPLVKCVAASHLYSNQEHIDKKPKLDKPPNSFKKPKSSSTRNKRKGCRCGNATAVPGKLTCCGQRCPCYVESKPCLECRCRGCRNPHTAEGYKIRPHIPELQNLQLQLSGPVESVGNCSPKIETSSAANMQQSNFVAAPASTIKLLSVYQTPTKINIKNIPMPQSIPQSNFLIHQTSHDTMGGSTGSEGDESDVQIDV